LGANSTQLAPNTYVQRNWRGAYGLAIDAIPLKKGVYAPKERARILDTFTTTTPGLGSPNANCPGGGAGIGTGGRPESAGANCIPQRNVLIVPGNKTQEAQANPEGGILVFSFDCATRIGHVGLLNVFDNRTSIEIVTHDYQNITIPVRSLGPNSVQLVYVRHAVFSLKVIFYSAVAVTEIGIFVPATAAEALSHQMGVSFAHGISKFDEYLPYLEFGSSYYLTREVNAAFGVRTGGCLTDGWANVEVSLTKKPALPLTAELKCGEIEGNKWVECPIEFVEQILEYKCTSGQKCVFEKDAAVCICGADMQFYCSDSATVI
jgi:hypothetical protein